MDMTFVSSPRVAQLMIELHNRLQDLNGTLLAHQTNHADQVDAELVVEMFPERKQFRARANCEVVRHRARTSLALAPHS